MSLSLKDILLGYLHKIMRKDVIINLLMNGAGLKMKSIEDAIKEVADNLLFVDRATWGLDLFEKELGIVTNYARSYEQRRASIKAKARGTGKLSLELIDAVCDAWKRADVLVWFEGGVIKIKFVDTGGVPEQIDDLKSQIEDIKPAHLPVEWLYSYLTWDLLESFNLTWDELEALNLTWDELEVKVN